MKAREIIEIRLGRGIGPLHTMPKDLRVALSRLAKELLKNKLSVTSK